MKAVKFSDGLYAEIEKILPEDSDGNMLEGSRKLSSGIQEIITRLRSFILAYRFEDTKEEIYFFKYIKPKFLSRLVYYQKIFEIRSNLPVGMVADINAYYTAEFNKLKQYIDANKELLIYYRTGSTLLDEIYFTRKAPELWLSITNDECENDPDFCTIFDQKLSKLLAYENVMEFIMGAINELAAPQAGLDPGKIAWTAPKAALIELIYALQTSGCFNNGAVDMKTLVLWFEKIFGVKLGNFYRTFQEIRIRKISRTTLLDELKENLIKRMDNSDENPKF